VESYNEGMNYSIQFVKEDREWELVISNNLCIRCLLENNQVGYYFVMLKQDKSFTCKSIPIGNSHKENMAALTSYLQRLSPAA
jgi:hypothetical protein